MDKVIGYEEIGSAFYHLGINVDGVRFSTGAVPTGNEPPELPFIIKKGMDNPGQVYRVALSLREVGMTPLILRATFYRSEITGNQVRNAVLEDISVERMAKIVSGEECIKKVRARIMQDELGSRFSELESDLQ